jgi:hypothetical protein
MRNIIRLLKKSGFYKYLPVVLVLTVSAAIVNASSSPIPYTFAPNSAIISAHVNANFDYLLKRSWDRNPPNTNLYYNDGDVGIGISNPSAKLEVVGNVKVSGNIDTGGLTVAGQILGTSTDSYWSASGTNIFYNSGSVGIGTADPQDVLHVKGNIRQEGGSITLVESGYPTVRLHYIGHAHSWGSDPNNWIAFYVSNGAGITNEWMRIRGDGKVGIGTTSPQAKLDIDGGVRTNTGFLDVNSTSNTVVSRTHTSGCSSINRGEIRVFDVANNYDMLCACLWRGGTTYNWVCFK